MDGEYSLTGCTIYHLDGYLGNIDDAEQSGNWFFSETENEMFYIDDAAPERVKVTLRGKEPEIADFINILLSDKFADEADGKALKDAWKSYMATGKPGQGATCSVSDDGRRIHFEWKSKGGKIVQFHDFCFWDCLEGNHKLVAHSRGTLDEDMADMSEASGVKFYNYNNDAKTISYLAYDSQLLPSYYVDGNYGVYFLKPEGADVVCINNQAERLVYLWNGDIFMKGEAFGL